MRVHLLLLSSIIGASLAQINPNTSWHNASDALNDTMIAWRDTRATLNTTKTALNITDADLNAILSTAAVEKSSRDAALKSGFAQIQDSCTILTSGPGFQRESTCSLTDLPGNYTSEAEMTAALNVYCGKGRECLEDNVALSLKGLIGSCGGKAMTTDPKHVHYPIFQQLYISVPRWRSYCRKDSAGKYCLASPGLSGTFWSKAHAFTCDECGKERNQIYADYEARMAKSIGKVLPVLQEDLKAFNDKCPAMAVTPNDSSSIMIATSGQVRTVESSPWLMALSIALTSMFALCLSHLH